MIDAGSSAALVAERSRKKADRLRRTAPTAGDLGRAERLDRFAKAWQLGADGENETARHLAWLPPGHSVVHDLRIPGSQANIDHLVVGPTGVFMIDTKASKSRVRISSDTVWRGRYPMTKEFETMRWEASRATQILGTPVQIVCSVVSPNPQNLDGEAGGILVVSAEKLCSRIQQLPRCLTEQEVAAIAAVIRRKWLTARVMTNERVDVTGASTAPPTVSRLSLLQRIILRFAPNRPR